MKHEWRKAEKGLYLPGETPELVRVPPMKFFAIRGSGNPNTPEFADKISALFTLAYSVRMMPKSGFTPDGYEEYAVYPLEGVWDLAPVGRTQDGFSKDQLVYTIMIRQPEFVTASVAARAMENASKKKGLPALGEAEFLTWEDGLCVQMMHRGSFDDEAKSFARMEESLESQGLRRSNRTHREIYLSDFNKTRPEDLKTVLRIFVEPKEGGSL